MLGTSEKMTGRNKAIAPDASVELRGGEIPPSSTIEAPRVDFLDPTNMQSRENGILDLLIPIVQRRMFIAQISVGALALAFIIAMLLPNRYIAEARILPPQQAQSSLASLLGSQMGQLGALAGIPGKDLGIKNPADLYIGILRSRSIADAIIDKFNLKKYYRDKKLIDAQQDLSNDVQFDAGKDGIITISVENKNARVAADIANEFIDQLYTANHRLALSEASQRRVFFEQQLHDESAQLADAELKMKNVQEQTGLIQLNSQSEAIIRSVAALRAQIASKEVELQAARSFATEQNPEVVRIQQELAALRGQLTKAERNESLGNGNVEVPTGKLPQAGLEYLRQYRELKYHESLYDVLAKEYEAARIDEGRSAAIIQVVDRAIEPDKKSSPPRMLICLFGLLCGFLASCIYVWAKTSFDVLGNDPWTSQKLQVLRASLRRKGWRD